MENKLQKLTEQLYEEGLSKGRADAEKLVADAQTKAKAYRINEKCIQTHTRSLC